MAPAHNHQLLLIFQIHEAVTFHFALYVEPGAIGTAARSVQFVHDE